MTATPDQVLPRTASGCHAGCAAALARVVIAPASADADLKPFRRCYARPMKPSLPVLPFTVALALLLVACNGNLEEYPDAKSVFRATYSASPPKDVTNLQAFGRAFRDSSTCYLRFNAPLARIQSLIGSTFTEIAPASFTSSTSNAGIWGPTPSWWAPPLTATSKFYRSTGFHPSFSSGQAYLALIRKPSSLTFTGMGLTNSKMTATPRLNFEVQHGLMARQH